MKNRSANLFGRKESVLFAMLFASILFSPNAFAQGFYFESESLKIPALWQEAKDVTGYSGKSYLLWKGGDQTGKPNLSGVLNFEFTVEKPGWYHVQVRGRRDKVDECQKAPGDHCNDLYSRMNATSWRKTMVDGPWGSWIWMGRLFYDEHNHTAIFNLNAGKNVFSVTGRSKGVKFDAVRIYYEKTTPPAGPGVTTLQWTRKNKHVTVNGNAMSKLYSITGRTIRNHEMSVLMINNSRADGMIYLSK